MYKKPPHIFPSRMSYGVVFWRHLIVLKWNYTATAFSCGRELSKYFLSQLTTIGFAYPVFQYVDDLMF